MARIHHVKAAQQRYEMVPVLLGDGTQKIVAVESKRTGQQKVTRKGKPVFQRQTVADKTKPLPMPKCGKCGVTIEVGLPYKWVSLKSSTYGSRTLVRCATCPTWRPSELTSSKMAGVYAAQEEVDDGIDSCETADDFQALAQSAGDQIVDVAEEYRESATNIEDGFGHATSTSDELNDRADELENWGDEIRNLDFDEFDEDAVDIDEREEDETDEEFEARKEAAIEEAREEWRQEQAEKLTDELGNCPV